MAHRLLIVCTRMCAQAGSNEDEYHYVWNGSNQHFLIRKAEAGNDVIFVVRGCLIADLVNQGKIDEAYAAFIQHVRKAIVSFERFEKKMVIHKGPFPLGPQAKYWKQFFSNIVSQIRVDLSLMSWAEYSHVGGFIYQELPRTRERWDTELFDRIWSWLFVGSKLEAYFDVTLNLAMGNYSGAEAAIEKHESDITHSASESERREWEELKKKIREWDVNQREANLVDLNNHFFRFAEEELIDRYPYLSEIE